MILSQVSWLDCVVFLVFLAPQLLKHVGFFPTLLCGLRALPFLLVRLPLGFFYDHIILKRDQQAAFIQQASLFEDVVIRCVRYAFAYIPASIGSVFFSKRVALPFLRFRMLRHGYLRWPVYWQEVEKLGFKGLWIINDPKRNPDVIVLYVHGGGFSMGSSYFYLEFLLAFVTLLKTRTHFLNPAILSVEYSLVPDASYPTQIDQVKAAYLHAVLLIKDSAKIIISGDSAGGTLVLSLLLHLGRDKPNANPTSERLTNKFGMQPGLAVLISPWCTLISPLDCLTTSDYLKPNRLHEYAQQYVGHHYSTSDPLLSPGSCTDISWWRRASPKKGFFITYGAEEVFAPEIRKLMGLLGKAGVLVEGREQNAGVHAWAVASLFLSSSHEKRLRGLEEIVKCIETRLGMNRTLAATAHNEDPEKSGATYS